MNPRQIGSPEAEQALLGCLLRLPAAKVLDLARRLDGEDLVDPRNRAVLAAAASVADRGSDPDPALVLGELRRLGLETSYTDDRPAALYVLHLFGAAGVPVNVEAYRLVVLEHAYRRRVVEAAQRLEQYAPTLGLDELRALLYEQVVMLQTAAARLDDTVQPVKVQAVA